MRLYGSYIGVRDLETALTVFRVYVSHIYWHELTHHIVEDIYTLKGNSYPLLTTSEEEGLAEWHAFLTAEERLSLPYTLYKIRECSFYTLLLSSLYLVGMA